MKEEMSYCKTIGEILGKERKDKKCSNREICRGLCSASTYNRYENDAVQPDKFLLDAFLERLGINPLHITYIASNDETKIMNLRKEIMTLVSQKNIREAEIKISEYSEMRFVKNERIHKQFILKVKGDISLIENNIDEALRLYKMGLKITQKGDFTQGRFYSRIEMYLFIKIIRIENKFNDLFWLEKYLRNADDNNILKQSYYSEIVTTVVNCCKNITNCKKIYYLNNAIQYKRAIGQFKDIEKMIYIKQSIGTELSNNEEIICKCFPIIKEELGLN